MIIGVTGLYCSGKDTVAEYLQQHAFHHISLSDLLRDILKEQGKKPTRANCIALGNKLRKEEGPGVLARIALHSMEPNRDYVVTSIRNPTEVEVLKARKDFILVSIEAPLNTRFERNKNRNRIDLNLSLEEFRKSEEQEQSTDPAHQQLNNTIHMARITVQNDKDITTLHKKLDKLLKDWKRKIGKRPSWDEYFLNIVHSVASRATCDRGKTAAIIVRNKRILSTGYVGAPIGVPHCDEVGHQMKKVTHEDGRESWHCLRTSHGEANAIALAARNGIAIEGATIYAKMAPCYACAKMIINAGIKRVVCLKDYHGSKEGKAIIKQAGVKLEILNPEITKYAKQ